MGKGWSIFGGSLGVLEIANINFEMCRLKDVLSLVIFHLFQAYIALSKKKNFCFINSFYKRKSIKNLAQVQGFPNSGKWWKESEMLLGAGGVVTG